jgi:enamine deaminase RidA (YjgF/YER057c/UK114 family)
VEREARTVLPWLAETLAAAGCDLRRDVVRIYQWMAADEVRMDPYNRVLPELIDEPRPASTAVGVRGLLAPEASVGVDLIALDGEHERQGFDAPPDVPQPVVRYSPALRAGDWVFLAGFLPTDFRGDNGRRRPRGERSALAAEARVNPFFWYGSEIEAQVEYTLTVLARIAEAAGTSLERCVKADVYMGHPNDLEGIDRVWRRWFPARPPARMLIPHSRLAGRGCRVEIALVLLAGDSPLVIETIETSAAPEPLFHEPQAVRAGPLLFLSTLLSATERNAAFPWYGQPVRLQLREALAAAAAICEAADTELAAVCRRQAFFDELAYAAETWDEWRAHFPADPPASTTVAVGGPLPVPGAHLMLDLVGYVPERKEEK